MNSFVLNLFDAGKEQRIIGVTSFIGEDASGSFGLQAQHARLMTSLIFGLAKFRVGIEAWQYLAVPGALLYFHDNELTISTRHYLLDENLDRISDLLQQQLVNEERELKATRDSLQRMEHAMLQRLWRLNRKIGR